MSGFVDRWAKEFEAEYARRMGGVGWDIHDLLYAAYAQGRADERARIIDILKLHASGSAGREWVEATLTELLEAIEEHP